MDYEEFVKMDAYTPDVYFEIEKLLETEALSHEEMAEKLNKPITQIKRGCILLVNKKRAVYKKIGAKKYYALPEKVKPEPEKVNPEGV